MNTVRAVILVAAAWLFSASAFAIHWSSAETERFEVVKEFSFAVEGKNYEYAVKVAYDSRARRMLKIEIAGPDGPVSIAPELYADIEYPIPGHFGVIYIDSAAELIMLYCSTKIIESCPPQDWYFARYPLDGRQVLKRYFMDQENSFEPPVPTTPVYKQ